MAPPKAKKRWDIKFHPGNFQLHPIQGVLSREGGKIKPVLHDPFSGFPAADILMLVPTTHMSEATLFQRLKCHRGRVVVAGEKITGFMGKPLPAFEPESLFPEFERAPVNKQHALVNPFHGH